MDTNIQVLEKAMETYASRYKGYLDQQKDSARLNRQRLNRPRLPKEAWPVVLPRVTGVALSVVTVLLSGSCAVTVRGKATAIFCGDAAVTA